MKNTYLVFNDPNNPKSGLCVATQEEWNQIIKTNRGVDQAHRRYFIVDCIEDGNTIDRMFIETTRSEYSKWQSRHVDSNKKRRAKQKYIHISLDDCVTESDGEARRSDLLTDEFNMEESVLSRVEIELLRKKLRCWNVWAEDLLECYLEGNKKHAVQTISDKYDVTIRTAQRWKIMFENYVMKFFAAN